MYHEYKGRVKDVVYIWNFCIGKVSGSRLYHLMSPLLYINERMNE